MQRDLLSKLSPEERQSILITHSLVTLMAFCAAFTVQALLLRFYPTWQLGYLPWLLALVAAEALLSLRQVRRYYSAGYEGLIYRLAEFVLTGVLLRAFIYLKNDWSTLGAQLQRALSDPITLLDGEFVTAWVCVLAAWGWATLMGSSLMALEGDEDILAADWNMVNYSNRAAELRTMATPLFGLGILLILLTFLAQASFQGLPGAPVTSGLPRGNIFLYFVLGFLLLTQGQLAVLRAGWNWLHIPIPRPIAGYWLAFGVGFLALLGAAALLLPTNLALGPMDALVLALSYVLYYLALFIVLLMVLVSWLITTVAPDRRQITQENIPEFLQQPLTNPPMAEQMAEAPPPFWEAIGATVFWIAFIGLVIYAVVAYARQNEGVMQLLQRFPGSEFLTRVWEFIDGLLQKAGQQAGIWVEAGKERLAQFRERRTPAAPWRVFRANRLSPRERVQFFYLSLVKRGEQQGAPRAAAQTPHEYAQTLENIVPEDAPEVEDLTGSFEEARYSRHAITEEQAAQMQARWQKLNRDLRKKD